MANEVKVVFEADANQLFSVADTAKARIQTTFANIPPIKLGFDRQMDSQLKSLTDRVQTLRQTLRDTSTLAAGGNGPVGATYATGAQQAATRARELYSELRQIRIEASRTADPKLFESLKAQAASVGTQIDALNRKMERVASGRVAAQTLAGGGLTGEQRYGRINLARQGADVFTQAGSGASPALIAIQQGPQIIEAVAQAGLKVSVAGTAIAGSIAAIGAVTVMLTNQYRDQAEKQLATEEKITSEWNKRNKAIAEQKKSIGELNVEFEQFLAKQRKDAERDPALRSAFNSLPVQLAQRNVNQPTLAQLKDLNKPLDEAVKANQEEFKKTLAADRAEKQREIDRYVNSLQSDIAAAAARGDKGALSNLQKEVALSGSKFDSATRLDFRAQFEKSFAEVVERGKKKVEELGKTWRNTFAELTVQAHSENPFVRLFSEGETAIVKLREQTRGLSDDLRQQFEQMQIQQNSLAVFKQRVETAFTAFDLREEAARFRGTGVRDIKGETDEEFRRRISSGIGLANNTGFFGLRRSEDELNRLTPQAAQQAYAQFLASQVAQAPGLTAFNRDTFTIGAFKVAQQRQEQNLSAKDRLDRQFGLLDTFRASSEAEKAVIDSRLIGLGRGVNSEDLRVDQREKLAAAFERQAEREERREQEKLEVQKQQLKMLRILAGEEEGLNKKAEAGGSQAIEVVLKNASEADATVRVSSPTQNDTSELYGFGSGR